MRTDIDCNRFKKRLQERHAAIIVEQESQKQTTAPAALDQARVGRLSRMDAMQQQEISKASARLVDLERQRILTALKRIKSGEYGYCILCEDDIAAKRLQFDPSLLTCIDCAQRAENN